MVTNLLCKKIRFTKIEDSYHQDFKFLNEYHSPSHTHQSMKKTKKNIRKYYRHCSLLKKKRKI